MIRLRNTLWWPHLYFYPNMSYDHDGVDLRPYRGQVVRLLGTDYEPTLGIYRLVMCPDGHRAHAYLDELFLKPDGRQTLQPAGRLG